MTNKPETGHVRNTLAILYNPESAFESSVSPSTLFQHNRQLKGALWELRKFGTFLMLAWNKSDDFNLHDAEFSLYLS